MLQYGSTYFVVDDYSFARGQRQTKQRRTDPVNVHYSRDSFLVLALVSEEYHDVQNEDQVQYLAADPCCVTDHQKLVGVLD